MSRIIHIRARHIFLVFTASVLALSFVLARGNYALSASGNVALPDNGGRVLLIDPGHGGFDGGAVGVNGTIEKDVNLSISLKLRDILTDAGFTVVMTRDTDCALNDSEDTTIRRRKISEMRNRLNLTKLYPDSVLVSVHQNKLTESSRVRGAQIFYSPNQPDSKVLAGYIQDEFNGCIQPDKPRETVKTGKNLYLFYHEQNVAVLCECGFLSNPDEEALLCTEAYQYKVAYCIFRGIMKWNEGLSD